MTQIHILEDDEACAGALAELLTQQGHEPKCFSAPHEFFYQLTKLPPRCAIIDWMLPQMSGLEVVRRTRRLVGGQMGIILLTALDDEDKAIAALEAGADDYIVKPATDVLLATRLEALLRRLVPAQTVMAKRIDLGPYSLEQSTLSATIQGRDAGLAPREFDLAWTLFSQPSRLFTKDELIGLVWGRQSDFDMHTIAQHVCSLRKKLELVAHGFKLQSVYGTGYRLDWIEARPLLAANGAQPHTTPAISIN
jgi:DNA-binding response OmpR family regulator